MDDVSEKFVARAINREARLVLEAGRTGCAENEADTATYHPRLVSGSQGISPEERWQAIAVMAYHLARTRGFVGEAVKYWLAAEARVNAELAIRQSAM